MVKTRVLLIFIFFLLVLSVFGENEQMYANNASFSHAAMLEWGENDSIIVNSKIMPKGDRDFFVINIENSGEFVFKVFSEDPAARFGIRVLDSNNVTIHDWIWGEQNQEASVVMNFTEAEKGHAVYFEVMQFEDNSEIDYTISAEKRVVSDYTEPNNRFREAMELEMDTITEAFIFPAGDHDYFKINIPSAGRLRIRLASEDPDVQLGARILTEENYVYNDWKYAIDTGEVCELVNDFKEETLIYLEISHKGDTVKSFLPYTIDVSLFAIRDEYEPNDSFKEAVALDMNTDISGYLFTFDDSDYFKISVSQTGLAKFNVDALDPAVRPAFRILTDENLLYNDWVTAPEFLSKVELEKELIAGDYYVELYSSGNYSTILPYKFRVTFEPSKDQNEFNNNFASAVEIVNDVVVEGEIFPKGDRDYYKIMVSEPGEMRIVIRSNPALKIGVKILDENNQIIQDWIYASENGDDLYVKKLVQDSGMYYLEVSNFEDMRGIILPYTLTVKLK